MVVLIVNEKRGKCVIIENTKQRFELVTGNNTSDFTCKMEVWLIHLYLNVFAFQYLYR